MNLHRSPQAVQDAIYSKEAQGPIPVVAVTDSSTEQLISMVPYFSMKDVNGFTEAVAGLAQIRGEMAEAKIEKIYALETWTNNKGRSIQASYVASNETDITLKLANGKSATFSTSNLSEKSKSRAKELAQ
jgi:hypothetical protein